MGLHEILILVGVVIAILWILMPFAIFGVKPLLTEILAEARETNKLLKGMQEQVARASIAPKI